MRGIGLAISKLKITNKKSLVAVALLLLLATAGSFVAFRQTKVSAEPPSPMAAGDVSERIFNNIWEYQGYCRGIPEKYQNLTWTSTGEHYWESADGGAKISVPNGATSKNLKLNNAVFLCGDLLTSENRPVSSPLYGPLPNDGNVGSRAALQRNYVYIVPGTTVSTGRLSRSPDGAMITIGHDNNSRYWMGGGGVDFTWDAGSAITSPRTVTVRGNRQVVNWFGGSAYGCVNGGGQVSGPPPLSPSQCPYTPFEFTFTIEPEEAGFTNQATLSTCPGRLAAGSRVTAGDKLCFLVGMINIGTAKAPRTFVDLNTSHPQYLTPNSIPPPTTGDPYVAARDHSVRQMPNGQTEAHYWWERREAPNTPLQYHSVQYQPVEYTIKSGPAVGTQLCFATLVSPEAAGIAYDSSNSLCFGYGVDGCTGNCSLEPCPVSQPGAPQFPSVNVTLPDQSPSSPLSPLDNPWGLTFTLTRDDTYYQDIRQNKTKVVDINDISSGGSPVSPTLISDATYQQATLNYSPYVTEYPYDFNQPSVTYDSYYNRTTWRSAASPSGYLCDAGWQLENGTGPDCLSYYPANQYYTCSSGWSGPTLTGYGYLCSRSNSHAANSSTSTTYSCPAGWSGPMGSGFGPVCRKGTQAIGATPTTTTTYSCPHADDSRSGSTCTHTDWTVANGPYYNCPNGGTVFNGGGFGMLCQRRKAGTPFYNWRNAGTANNQTTRATTTNTHRMIPCYNRTYDAYPTAGTSSLTPDPESPTQSSFSGQINVTFGTPSNTGRIAMRERSRVNLPYTISYFIERANGGGSGQTTDINRSVTITANDYNKTSSGATSGSDNISASFSVSVPGSMQVGDRVCWTLYTTSRTGNSQTTGQMDTNGNITSGNGRRQDGGCTVRVHNQPYSRVYGGDVLAGSGFGVGCAINTNAGILGWNRGNGAGSAVQFAAQAAGVITDYTSATQRSSGPVPPRGLSFGNVNGTYGGSFGSGACAKDYFAMAKPANIQTSYPNPAATYTVPLGAREAVFIDGDAFIRRNVIYAGNGSWSSLSQIPSYYVIVRGNIYISEQVTQLDGVYIAQPRTDGSGGRIYTCAEHGTMAIRTTSPEAFNRCATKLTINGAFIARQIRFLRTNGSLRDSSPGEASTSGSIAEVFNYSPELFLIDPGLSAAPARQYDSASGLPPVL